MTNLNFNSSLFKGVVHVHALPWKLVVKITQALDSKKKKERQRNSDMNASRYTHQTCEGGTRRSFTPIANKAGVLMWE